MKNHKYLSLAGLLSISILLCDSNVATAQLQVDTDVTAIDLVETIIGPGITTSNVNLDCANLAFASFSGGITTNIGLDSGVLLTTGEAETAIGPNTSSASTTIQATAGDADLSALVAPFSTFDACVLEFDFIPDADELTVQYVFASEEYPNYVCSIFNDVFAFFVSGPRPDGGNYDQENVALIPGTDLPVSINNVNNGSIGTAGSTNNCDPDDLIYDEFYVDNAGGLTIEYNGFTVVLTASVALIPGESYTFKFAIADVGDPTLDSGVFIKASSFTSFDCLAGEIELLDGDGCHGNATATVSTTSNKPGGTYTYLVTKEDLEIVALFSEEEMDLQTLPVGPYLIWGVSYEGELYGAEIGANANEVTSDGCVQFSNSIEFEVVVCNEPELVVLGCTDQYAINFNPEATVNDGSCEYEVADCDNFRYYLADSPVNAGTSDIYGVEINGDNADLTFIATVPYQAHLAFNEDVAELYIVNRSGGAFQTYDFATSTLSAPVSLSISLSNVAQAVVSPEGDLIIGSESSNLIYSIDVSTGDVLVLPTAVLSITGGDLVYGANGTLYYASRNNGGKLIDVGTGAVVGNMPTAVTGAALTPSGTLMTTSRNFDELREYGSTGSPAALSIYPTLLNGEAITVKSSDLASGCFSPEPVEEGCFGHEILVYELGSGNVIPARQNSSLALGAPQRIDETGTINFVTLGFGGTLIIGFEEAAIATEGVNDLEVVETTWDSPSCTSYEERADVYVSQQVVNDPSEIDDDLFVLVGQSCTNGEFFDVYDATGGWTYFTMVKFVDVSPVFTNRDGYDVDGIVALNGCQPVPEFDEQPEPGDCNATEVVEYLRGLKNNGSAIADNRAIAAKALGAPERTNTMVFITLGYGGSITLGFDGAVPNLPGPDLEVVETSFGNPGCAAYPEYADVYVSQDGEEFHLATTVCKSEPFVDISDAGDFDYIMYVKIATNDSLTTTPDAYDLDGVVALHNCEGEPVTPPSLQDEALLTQGYVWDGTLANDPEGNITIESFQQRTVMSSMPNPTTGPSLVSFTSAESTRTLLEVYDMSGRQIDILLNQDVEAGETYRVEYDAAALPNGVYLYRLSSAHEVVIEKFMLVR